MRQLFFIAALCLLSGAAAAVFDLQDPALPAEESANEPVVEMTGNYAVEGAGVQSCADYHAESKKNSSMHYIDINWAKGFITGVNYIRVQTMESSPLGAGLDLDSLTLWIDNYCLENPRATLSDASAALVNELMD
jgi:hypothetical protein